MFPIRDTNVLKNKPIVNNTIIIINITIFLTGLLSSNGVNEYLHLYGLIPAKYSNQYYFYNAGLIEKSIPFFTFMFLHGGFWHILANLWSLYIFGDNIEDYLGHKKYLLFYLLCGIISGITHIIFNLDSTIPVIGASGAIAGIMGAYLILYPRAKILTLFPIIFIPFQAPAYIFFGIWFAYQFINATFSRGVVSSIAWWAHIGGFLAGIFILKAFKVVSFTDFAEDIKKNFQKKETDKINIANSFGTKDDPNLYIILDINSFEALAGVQKIINIPWGFYNRVYKVNVPKGVSNGQILRLKGLGKSQKNGNKGDLMLKIRIVQLSNNTR